MKYVFGIYLNKICYIVFLIKVGSLVFKVNTDYMRCLATKGSQKSTYFQIQENCVAMETESCIFNKGFNMSKGFIVYAVQLKHYYAYIVCVLLKLC